MRNFVRNRISDMDARPKILVVEDDPTLCEMLRLNLGFEGYDVVVAHSAEEAMLLDLSKFALILLDVMMGEMSGFEMARIVKSNAATASVPIIFCTAKDSEDDMVGGLTLGADDYICKPYTMRNLIARVKAVLRRAAAQEPKAEQGIEIDAEMKRVKVDGCEVKLVKKEFEILQLLVGNPGKVFSREEILRRVWRGEVIVLDRTIDVNITRIRQKIAPYGDRIVTRPGYGYAFE